MRTPGWSTRWVAPVGCISVNGPGTTLPWPDMNPQIKVGLEQLCGASYDDDVEAFRLASPDQVTVPDPPPVLFLIVGHAAMTG